ncbi:Uu.00g097280.m01.CDS01 [Anthostomella pinea]|uniref:Uu.00g097280.m01.CDS01 n=1 Tax=Anthostomella pinea TaxID=933095 RepID=A0AAI8YCM0_9PEZI|nr:Uu.00g097280.m01.CDS01 [Anthostomella pinea]
MSSFALAEHPSALAEHPTGEYLLPSQQQELIIRNWGLCSPSLNRARHLEAYLLYYENEAIEARHIGGRDNISRWHGNIQYFLEAIKRNPTIPRRNLRAALRSMCSDKVTFQTGSADDSSADDTGGNVNLPFNTPLALSTTEVDDKTLDAAIAVSVKILFAVHVNPGPPTGGVTVGNWETFWEDSRSLEAFIAETFPSSDYSDETNCQIIPARIRARYLENNADVRIEWTHHLPDHLKLDIGFNSKVLSIFELASLLEVMYEAIEGHPYDQSMADSVKHGRYSLAFLHETLETIRLMFLA